MKDLLRRVVSSGVYQEKNFKEDPFPAKVLGAEVWALMARVISIMGPLLLLCRLADGQKPVISKLYGTQLYVRQHIQREADAAGNYYLIHSYYYYSLTFIVMHSCRLGREKDMYSFHGAVARDAESHRVCNLFT